MNKLPKVAGVRFRLINEFPAYAVGDDGSIWSSKTKQWKQLKHHMSSTGEARTSLGRDGKNTSMPVAQVVFDAFSRRKRGDKTVFCKDGDRSNCRFDNLELRLGKFYREERPRSKYPVKYILDCKAKGMTLTAIARRLHAEPNMIGNILYSVQYARHRDAVLNPSM